MTDSERQKLRCEVRKRTVDALLMKKGQEGPVTAVDIRVTFLDLLESLERLREEGGLRWARISKGLAADLRRQTREFERRVKARGGSEMKEVQNELRQRQHPRTG